MYKIYVRWNRDGQGYHVVELERNGVVALTQSFASNNDRLYGYCLGMVSAMKHIGIPVEMPKCLTDRRLCADQSRED